MKNPTAPEAFVEDVMDSAIKVLSDYSADSYFREAIAKVAVQKLVWGLLDAFKADGDPLHDILADDLDTLASVVREDGRKGPSHG